MNIELEKGETKGRYIAHFPGVEGVAELGFSIASKTMVIADHTDVPETMKGKGVAQALFFRFVEDARADGFKIIPLCPFVKAQFGKHPETRDVT